MTILFNSPLKLNNQCKNNLNKVYYNNDFHGPGQNYIKIQKLLKKKYNFSDTFLTNSCTSALEISALCIGLSSKDEVILPSYSFITTGSSFARTGAKLVYCDINLKNLMPSFSDITKKVTSNTKAIVILHYQGFGVDYLLELKKYCKKKKIFLIEDAAQALGTKCNNRFLGKFGDLSCFSFHKTKNIHTGSGGLLVVNNKKLLKKIKYIYDKGTNRIDQIKGNIKYYSWVEIGSNFMMTELHASLLLDQIKNYNKYIKFRKGLYETYIKNLQKHKNFELITSKHKNYNYHALVLLCRYKISEKLIRYLKKYKIQGFVGYYPLHLSKFGKKYYLNTKNSLRNTDNIFKRVVRLPLHNSLKFKEIEYITKVINLFFLEKKSSCEE